CEKMLSVIVVLPDDKQRLKDLIPAGIALEDFTEEVKKAVEKRKKKEDEKSATSDEKAAIVEDSLVAELEELGDELEEDSELEEEIIRELEDLDKL
ncbi:MAG: hypothetical protein KJ773_04835, partial [Candidatus Thermoplasmatota archaeon]|nr:hypothetical protein [Candidatus Thermoplasmatota archaeon]